MGRAYNGKGLAAYRDEVRKESLERYNKRQAMYREQREREQLEKLQHAQTPKQAMQEKAAQLLEYAGSIEPGDPRALTAVKHCICELAEIANYILNEQADTNPAEHEPQAAQ